MVRFEYLKPKSIDEAISFHQCYRGKAKYIAGGTDVMVKVKEGKISPDCLISLKHIQGLDQVSYMNGELRIGALSTHRMLECSSIIRKKFPILTDAIEKIGSVQIRNVATLAGNIVNAVPSADGAIPLVTLGASVRIYGPKGERTVSLEDFFVGPGETLLEGSEILLELVIPKHFGLTGAAYWKHTRRAAMELPIMSVGVLISLEGDRRTCLGARIGLGVVAPTPMRARNAENFLKEKELDDEVLAEAGKLAAMECKARDTFRGEAWYRRAMVEVFVPRMARLAMERAK